MDASVSTYLTNAAPLIAGLTLGRATRAPAAIPRPITALADDRPVRALLAEGKTTEALRLYRQMTGQDIRQSIAAIEALETRLPARR
jgi:pentatricopeptide repeat protein